MDRRLMALVVCACALMGACAGMLVHPSQEKLFLALQIERGGQVIARPRLLGATGRMLTMRLMDPDLPDRPKVDLQLLPEREGKAYHVQIQLTLPDRAGSASGELELGHGQERSLILAERDRPVTVRVLLMRVASPEFEAYMSLARRPVRTS